MVSLLWKDFYLSVEICVLCKMSVLFVLTGQDEKAHKHVYLGTSTRNWINDNFWDIMPNETNLSARNVDSGRKNLINLKLLCKFTLIHCKSDLEKLHS